MSDPNHPGPARADDAEFEHPLLDEAAAAELVERLLDVEGFWIARHARLPFHTLGATNYYDITANPARPYARLAARYNPFLLAEFGPLYAALAAALRERLGRPVAWLADTQPATALPGFHIFGADPAFAAREEHDVLHGDWFRQRDGEAFPGNPIHVDTSHLALGLDAQARQAGDATPLATLSFTLPLALPEGGAGMRLWDFGHEATRLDDRAAQQARLRRGPTRELAYRPGTLFLHSGTRYHQARGFPVRPGQYRITLQGHGAWLDGAWRLFW
ncbi:hypothetical protein [Burkholderia gladioli]|uniref:hypothetical protein n=1 Tax=Burkholderia gladioli TaxID=28095 RepID=UPI00164181D5|nr:hypothetical protein [Burkholderia gladioli]